MARSDRLETLLRGRRQPRRRVPADVPVPSDTLAKPRSPAVVIRHGPPETPPADGTGPPAGAGAATPTKLRVAGMSKSRSQLLLTSMHGDRFVLTVDHHLVELVDRVLGRRG